MNYDARTPWSPFAALLVVAAILVVSVTSALAAYISMRDVFGVSDDSMAVAVAMLVMQSAATALVLMVASRPGGERAAVLSLDRRPRASTIAAAGLGMLLILIPFNAIVYAVSPETFVSDLAPFKRLILSPAGPLFFFVVAVGAPLSEELVFRGFLQSALARSRFGYWGAAVITTTLWTFLHAGYSVFGLLEVFVIGVYFAALLWWTGSLWVPLICHAVYNGALFVLLLFLPLPAAV